jgi:UDP-N-acetylglucosamine 2-epimerase (non-hydrolysing)
MKTKKIKILTLIGTRPEIIRLSRVINEIESHRLLEHVIVHTGQNYDYELNEIFFSDLSIRKPDFFLEAAKESAMSTIGNIFIKLDHLIETIEPDAFLVLGDTNSCLGSLVAKKRKVPVFHMEAGNRCFDQRVPEEINRVIVDHTSDINLTYSDIAREYLLKENFPPDRIIKTGSPMFEVLEYYKKNIENSKILEKLKLSKDEYFLVSAHRDENISSDKNFDNLIDSLNKIAEKYHKPIIFSTHPRTRIKLEKYNSKQINKLIQFIKPLGFYDYNFLQMNAATVLSDSGTISEESSILGFPALNLREAHERPEAMEEASVMMVGLNPNKILIGLDVLISSSKKSYTRIVSDYKMPNVSKKIVRIIISYIDYVNLNVWKKTI